MSSFRKQILIKITSLYVLGCCQKPRRQSLQKYEKSENHMLICTDCPQTPVVQNSRSQEHCARKCKKKNFICRWVTASSFFRLFSEFTWFPCIPVPCSDWLYLHIFCCLSCGHLSTASPVCVCRAFNFQKANRKCYLLPFDRFTHGAQKQANINFTLCEKKGKCYCFQRHVGVFLMRTVEERRICSSCL